MAASRVVYNIFTVFAAFGFRDLRIFGFQKKKKYGSM